MERFEQFQKLPPEERQRLRQMSPQERQRVLRERHEAPPR